MALPFVLLTLAKRPVRHMWGNARAGIGLPCGERTGSCALHTIQRGTCRTGRGPPGYISVTEVEQGQLP